METKTATFGGGCFWCTEAAFKELEGVEEVTSGYAGGDVEDPTYEQVCTGETGHAEVIQVEYDPDHLRYSDLLEVLFTVHDPTQEDRQGPDVGTQYRSIILYHNEEQQEVAEEFIEELEEQDTYDEPIQTEVVPLEAFYPAEDHHQDYFEKNPSDGYCRIHAAPKIEKVREVFSDRVEGQDG